MTLTSGAIVYGSKPGFRDMPPSNHPAPPLAFGDAIFAAALPKSALPTCATPQNLTATPTDFRLRKCLRFAHMLPGAAYRTCRYPQYPPFRCSFRVFCVKPNAHLSPSIMGYICFHCSTLSVLPSLKTPVPPTLGTRITPISTILYFAV